jgi:phospholipid/cholesterol/gamma-HCH transport system substrate-binding protein
VSGATTAYSAEFTDVLGLRDGDDVRMAGVRVGRVMNIDLLPGSRAMVNFELQNDQKLLGNTEASILYQNIVGQRYVDLRLGATGDPTPLPAGSVIPVDRTVPSFDVGVVLNGYEPLFATIDPKAADQISSAAIQALQGDSASWATLVDQTGKLTDTFAGRDQLLGDMITGLDRVFGTLASQNDNLDATLANTRQMVNTFNARRPELVASMGSLSRVVRQLSAVTREVNPSLQALITRQPGFAAHLIVLKRQCRQDDAVPLFAGAVFLFLIQSTEVVTQVPPRPDQNDRSLVVHAPRIEVGIVPSPQLLAVALALCRLNTRQEIVPQKHVAAPTSDGRADCGRLIRPTLQRHPLACGSLVRADSRIRKHLAMLVRLDDIAHFQAETVRQVLRMGACD